MIEIKKYKIKIAVYGLLILAALGIAGSLAYTLVVKDKYSEEAEQAAKLMNSGDYAGARDFLKDKIDSDSAPELRLLLAKSYLEAGDADKTMTGTPVLARELLLEVERSGYESAELYDMLGYSAEIINDIERAFDYYKKAIALKPRFARPLYGIGRYYFFTGDAVKAKEYYGKAEKAITGSTDDLVKARIYSAQAKMKSDPKKSEEYFLKALALSSSKASKSEALANLSGAKYLQGDFSKAIEYADLAIKTDPSNAMGYIAYAKTAISDIELLQKNAPKVEGYLMTAIFLAPRGAEPQYWMGKLDAVFGKYDYAIKSYDRAATYILKDENSSVLARASLMSDVFFDEAIVYYKKKDPKYKVYFREAFKLNPAKTLLALRDNPSLKKMMIDFTADGRL